MTATRKPHSTNQTAKSAWPQTAGCLHLAFELGWNEWKLAFATGPADNPRLRNIAARDTQALLQEIGKAKKRFGLSDDAPVRSCYEAGRDGFWLHRFLQSQGIDDRIVDSSSIEVKRQGRRRKTDRIDVAKLLSMLIRWHQGERNVWSVVEVSALADEDRRQLHRDLIELKAERTQHVNRIKGLLAGCGLAMPTIDAEFPQRPGVGQQRHVQRARLVELDFVLFGQRQLRHPGGGREPGVVHVKRVSTFLWSLTPGARLPLHGSTTLFHSFSFLRLPKKNGSGHL